MKAIITKYIGPTNIKCSRIKATAEHHSVTISYDYDFDTEGAHKKAAEALKAKMGWQGNLIAGGTIDGYVFVFEPVATERMRDALGNLCQHVMGNRGNKTGNPYSVPEMQEALKALHLDATGNYTSEYSDYVDAANGWKK